MPEKTEAQKRAQKNYMDKFVRVEIRMTAEQREEVQAHAEAQGESTNGFINARSLKQWSGTGSRKRIDNGGKRRIMGT